MRCVEIVKYVVPMYGNMHSGPYGKLLVEHDGEQKIVIADDMTPGLTNHITFNRKCYEYHNVGTLYAPVIEFLDP